MKKIILSLVILQTFVSAAFSQIRVGILNGPSCIPVANMMENIVSIDNQELSYEKFSEATKLLPKMIKNEIDIGFLPVNVAAKVYNTSNRALVCAAITGYGNLALITKDKTVSSFQNLKGKTVYVAGQGATPDYLMQYLLKENEIETNCENGITLDYTIPTAQIAPALISGKIEYAVVPEPFITIAQMKDNSIYSVIDFQKEFSRFNKNEDYPLTVLVVNKKFAEEHNETLHKFLDEYSKAWGLTIALPAQSAQLCEKYDLGLPSAVVSKSIPKTNYVFISAKDGKESIEKILSIFMELNPSSVGAKLPDEEFYFN